MLFSVLRLESRQLVVLFCTCWLYFAQQDLDSARLPFLIYPASLDVTYWLVFCQNQEFSLAGFLMFLSFFFFNQNVSTILLKLAPD